MLHCIVSHYSTQHEEEDHENRRASVRAKLDLILRRCCCRRLQLAVANSVCMILLLLLLLLRCEGDEDKVAVVVGYFCLNVSQCSGRFVRPKKDGVLVLVWWLWLPLCEKDDENSSLGFVRCCCCCCFMVTDNQMAEE